MIRFFIYFAHNLREMLNILEKLTLKDKFI